MYVFPARGREMRVEVVSGTYDFKKWMDPVMVSLSGLTIQLEGENVNNALHFIRREDMINFKGSHEWQVQNTFQDLRGCGGRCFGISTSCAARGA